MIISYICMVVGIVSITVGSLVYIKYYRQKAKETIMKLAAEDGTTDPGAYLCGLAEKGYIQFGVSEEKLKLVIKEAPLEREFPQKKLFSDVLEKHAGFGIDDNATVGYEIIDYDEVKNEYIDWLTEYNPGEGNQKIYPKHIKYRLLTETKIDALMYGFIVSLVAGLSMISNLDISLYIVVVMFLLGCFAYFLGSVFLEGWVLSDGLWGKIKDLLMYLIFCSVGGGIVVIMLHHVGKGVPMLILRIYAEIWMLIIALVQKGLVGRYAPKQPLFTDKIKPEYIFNEALSKNDNYGLTNKMYLIKKVLWDEKN